MAMKGIDVSTHNGAIDHAKIKAAGIEFAMVRAGYGKGNIDKQFKNNIEGFIKAGIHVGAYWFLYSLTEADAKAEADYFNEALSPYKGKLTFPVACDFEYDSENYMKKNGVTPSKSLNTAIVKAFCSRMEEHGWYVVNYANIDYINNHFNQSELERFDLWCAQWKVDKCSKECGIWQYTSDGSVNGSSARTDMNYAYKDYPTTIKSNGLNGFTKTSDSVSSSTATTKKSVTEIAKAVIAGEYGNGSTRKTKLEAEGYNYTEVQTKVNELLGVSTKKAATEEIAKKVIRGEYGNGETRKQKLEAEGYDYNEVQTLVNKLLG